jgi:hypothetical protein
LKFGRDGNSPLPVQIFSSASGTKWYIWCNKDASEITGEIVMLKTVDSFNLRLHNSQIRRPGFDSQHYQKKSCWSGTGSTQPLEYNWGATW